MSTKFKADINLIGTGSFFITLTGIADIFSIAEINILFFMIQSTTDFENSHHYHQRIFYRNCTQKCQLYLNVGE